MSGFWLWLVVGLGAALIVAGILQSVRAVGQRERWFGIALLIAGLSVAGVYVALASRVSNFLFQRLIIPIDLPALFNLTVLPVGGFVLGIGLPILLLWVAQNPAIRKNTALLIALFLVPILLGVGAMIATTLPVETASNAPNAVETPGAPSDMPTVQPLFAINRFYEDVKTPTSIAFGLDGRLYVAELSTGEIKSLADLDGDGKAEDVRVFADKLKNAKGIAFRPGTNELYVSMPGEINMVRDTNGDGIADERRAILTGLAVYDIEHSNNGIAFGPDGRLYIAIGGERVRNMKKVNDEYFEKDGSPLNPLAGGILVADPDGKNLTRFARGMRNPYDLAFDTQGRLFATDNGADSIPNPAGDELNYVVQDGDYGYPYTFGFPAPWEKSRAPTVNYRVHSSPDGLVAYDGQMFPAEFRGNLLLALWSDESRVYSQADYERGYARFYRVRKIDRVKLVETPEGLKGESEDFAWNFVHPIDVTVGPDGALYVADFSGNYSGGGGDIYRIVYTGK